MKEMDRKEFFQVFWKKRIKPLILIAGLVFAIQFFINVFKENGAERFVTMLILAIGILLLLVTIIGSLFKKSLSFLYSKLSPSVKNSVIITGKIIDYLTPIIFGITLYQMWMKDWIFTSLFFGFIMLRHIIQIIRKERMAFKGN
ncbi:MAG: hypothetical protein N4A41_08945 [Crocinitomicaceae bacterium]|jgi:protein-S-isoprenylcysteine O-methyltransferase Ste14|nr:hypothetical protein [Crocinitomicaceae bacterium]